MLQLVFGRLHASVHGSYDFKKIFQQQEDLRGGYEDSLFRTLDELLNASSLVPKEPKDPLIVKYLLEYLYAGNP